MKKITAIVFAILIGFGCTANASCPKFKNYKKGDEITPLFIAIGSGEKTFKIKGDKYKIILSKKHKNEIRENSSFTTSYNKEYKALSKSDKKSLDSIMGRVLKSTGVKIKHKKSKNGRHNYEITCKGESKTVKFSLEEK